MSRRSHNKTGTMIRHRIVKINTPSGQPTHERVVTWHRFSPKSKKCEPHSRLPSLGVLHEDDKPPEYVASKVERAYFCKSQRAMEKVNATLKGHTQNITHSGTQNRINNLKNDGFRSTYRLWREARGNSVSP